MTHPTREPSDAEIEAVLDHIYRLHAGCLARGPCKPGARPIRGCICRSICRAALTAAAQVREGWQLIGSAPAGTDILLCWPSGARRVGYFNGKCWLCDGVSFDEEPTHWMPLPEPPMPIYGATEPDSGPSVLGLRKEE